MTKCLFYLTILAGIFVQNKGFFFPTCLRTSTISIVGEIPYYSD